METWTVDELKHLTREELCDLARRLEAALAAYEAGTAARSEALASLAAIRRVMLRRGLHY